MNLQAIEKNYLKHNLGRLNSQYFLGSLAEIWDKDKKLFGAGVGFGDIEKRKPLKGDSIFRMASMTKPILGCAFMQQVEQGRIGLDIPVSEYIPEFANMKVSTLTERLSIGAVEDARDAITPRMLLSHSSGIGCGDSFVVQARYLRTQESLKKSVQMYATSALDFQPGTAEAYSGTWAFDICARLVEILTDMPYEAYIKKYIFDPLGMKDTTYLPNDEQLTRVVDYAARTFDGFVDTPILPRAGFEGAREGYPGGGAGMFSTMNDYSRFARMLLNGGQLDGVRILQTSTVDEMTVNQKIFPANKEPEYTQWGLSMRVCREQNENQPLPVGAFGWSGSYGTHFWIDRTNGIACVYMMNLSNARGAAEPAAREFEWDVMSGF